VPPIDATLTLYMEHRAELLNYASGIIGDRARAEDVVQEAYLRFADAAARRLSAISTASSTILPSTVCGA